MNPSELTEWRKKKGFTQKVLAEKLGVAENTVFRWEKGIRPISPLLPHALRGLEAEGGELKNKGKKTKK